MSQDYLCRRIPDTDVIDSETVNRSLGLHVIRKRKNSIDVKTAARYEQIRDEQRRPTHKFQSKRHGTSSSSSSSTQSSLSNGKDFALRDVKVMPTKEDINDLKMIKVKLKSLELRYQNEVRERANVELRQKELEVENRKLKYEVSLLKTHFMVMHNLSCCCCIIYSMKSDLLSVSSINFCHNAFISYVHYPDGFSVAVAYENCMWDRP